MAINVRRLIAYIIFCELAGVLGAVFTISSLTSWYLIVVKPSFIPQPIVFSLVWPVMYLLMGVAAYLVFSSKTAKKYINRAFYAFGAQLVLNVLWTFLFFGLNDTFYALIEAIAMWMAILITIITFYRVNKLAACLLVPYFVWVSFAIVLNYYILVLNP